VPGTLVVKLVSSRNRVPGTGLSGPPGVRHPALWRDQVLHTPGAGHLVPCHTGGRRGGV